ncbi:MAG: glycosyltransferase family 39 protein [Snowella sp.]|nr:glycosyltransferase family 39 protein [Snowella sp.]
MNSSPSVFRSIYHQWRKEERWLEWLCLGGLLIAALLLFGLDLGNGPLLEGEEAIVAQIGRGIAQSTLPFSEQVHLWFTPTLFGKPYFGTSFLVPDLIAIAYRLWGIQEWTTRLPIALLSAISIPVLYRTGIELFRNRLTAVFAALVYLTLFPVVYWGRLATNYGLALFFTVLLIQGILRSRRDLRFALLVGLSLTGLLFSQPLLGLLLPIPLIVFWGQDTPRLLQSPLIGVGILLGLIPAFAWYSWQGYHYGSPFFKAIFFPVDFSLQRSGIKLIALGGLKLISYSLPWFVFAIYGFHVVWKSRHWSWARFLLNWLGSYSLLTYLMPGIWDAALIPFYPALAFLSAIAFNKIRHFPPEKPYPKLLRIAVLFFALGMIFISLCFYLNFPIPLLTPKDRPFVLLILVFLSLTLSMTANLFDQQKNEFIPIFFWGIYISFLLWVNTSFWLGFRADPFPIKTMGSLIQEFVPKNQVVYTSFPKIRSDLNFYSDHQVIPTNPTAIISDGQNAKFRYLLLDQNTLKKLNQASFKILGESRSGWSLITQNLPYQKN